MIWTFIQTRTVNSIVFLKIIWRMFCARKKTIPKSLKAEDLASVLFRDFCTENTWFTWKQNLFFVHNFIGNKITRKEHTSIALLQYSICDERSIFKLNYSQLDQTIALSVALKKQHNSNHISIIKTNTSFLCDLNFRGTSKFSCT